MSERFKTAAEVAVSERRAIAGIPQWLAERMEWANRKFVHEGGCRGCGSLQLGVHDGDCAELANHPFD